MKKPRFTHSVISVFILLISSLTVKADMVQLSKNHTHKDYPSSAVSINTEKEDGVLICWYDEIDNGSLYVQKTGKDGTLFWGPAGYQADNNLGNVLSGECPFPEIFSDNEGGAYIVYRKLTGGFDEIYFQRIKYDCSSLFKPVCLSAEYPGYNYSHNSVKCFDKTVIVSWENFNNGDFNIHAQKIDLNGNKLWNKGRELIVCGQSNDQRQPVVLCSKENVFFTWLDTRSRPGNFEFGYSLYANKLDLNGNYTDFSDNGKLIFENVIQDSNIPEFTQKIGFYNHNMVISDDNSFITAIEKQILDEDSYVKVIRADENLNVMWEYDIDANSFQSSPLIASDGQYGAFIFWNDMRNGGNSLFGIRLSSEGSVLTGGANGSSLSSEFSKDNLKKSIPSAYLESGICSSEALVLIPWTAGEEGKLYLSSVGISNSEHFKTDCEMINDLSSGGEFASVNYIEGNIVLIFKNNGHIYAYFSFENPQQNFTSSNKSISYNFPNPFNPVTNIHFDIPVNSKVKITVYNSTGQKVAEPLNDYKTAGKYSAVFNAGKADYGMNLPSGVYFYRIEIQPDVIGYGMLSETGRMLLVK